VIDKTHI